MNRLTSLVFPVALVVSSLTGVAKEPAEDLARLFQSPPREARPWVFWIWLDSVIPHETITRDLEEMKAKGITGCILYGNQTGRWKWDDKIVLDENEYRIVKTGEYTNSYMTPMPPGGQMITWSAPWRETVRFAAKEAGRLGLDLTVCVGLANTSGAITEEYGEQKLVWSETQIQGGQTFDGVLPKPGDGSSKGKSKSKPGGYYRDVAVIAVPVTNRKNFPAAAIDLTGKMDESGRLRWNAPSGNWKVLRFAHIPTGKGNAWGLFNDSMSTKAMDQQWAVTMGALLKEMTPEERRGLKGIEDDSWESGITTWTKRFPEEFKKRRGYSITPYLPIIAGVSMGNDELRAKVLRDYSLTISDLISEYHYGYLRKLANDNGLVFHSEAAGPNYDQADVLKTSSQVDVAMGEFWMPSTHRPSMSARFMLRNAASANHVYGKKYTLCESFSSLGPEWEESLFDMKSVGDQAFCDGLNRVCVHAFSQSPSLTAKPGYVYCAGTHFEPGVTWWNQTPAFNQYIARCCALLQPGKSVADALFYYGDNIGKGEPRKLPLSTLGDGYDHDNCNSEVLLTRMKVRDGRIVLPDGMSYRVLVLAEQQQNQSDIAAIHNDPVFTGTAPANATGRPMPFDDLKKLAGLVEDGATVIGQPPNGMSGMPRDEGQVKKFASIVAKLWGGLDRTNVTVKKVGKGRVIWGQTARQVLLADKILPDFEVAGVSAKGFIDWVHRRAGDADVYYVASRWLAPEKVNCAFRVACKQPELWDSVTGEMRDATAFRQENGRTVIPLEFGPSGSTFVVFRKPIPENASGKTKSNYRPVQPLATLAGSWTVNFDPKWGGPKEVVFNQLMDWTNSPDPGIKHYSGTAIYHKKFDLPSALPKANRLFLDLGEVHEVASVRLNGRDLGVLWMKPSRVDITDAVKARDNVLEVTVVNLWPNRLILDETLPKASRLTESNMHKFGAATSLLPSGLLGPVSLLAD